MAVGQRGLARLFLLIVGVVIAVDADVEVRLHGRDVADRNSLWAWVAKLARLGLPGVATVFITVR